MMFRTSQARIDGDRYEQIRQSLEVTEYDDDKDYSELKQADV